MKFFFTGVLVMIITISLHAEEGVVFYGNAKVYGKEFLHSEQKTKTLAKKAVKKEAKIEKTTTANVENTVSLQKPLYILNAFPFTPSSSSFLQSVSESAAISLQEKFGGSQQIVKAGLENAFSNINDLNSSVYSSQQRQKLSIAATQCGMLTSFGSQSPPDSLTEMSSRA